MRPTLPALVAALITLVVTAGCQQPSIEQIATTATVPVAVEVARIGLLQTVITVTGVVTAAPGAEMVIVAPASARITQLPHGEGDQVKAGDVLVTFDIPTLAADVAAGRARVTQAMARVDASRAGVDRLSSLLAQGVAARRDVEDATRQRAEADADLIQAQSAVEAAVQLSSRATVRAPFSGVVAKRYHNPGDLVEAAAGDPVLRLLNPSHLQVAAAVPSSDLSRVVVGQVARIRQAGREEAEGARVLAKAPQIDPVSATANVRLAFATTTALMAGMTVQVEIVADQRSNALIIPVAALVNDEGGLFVMVAGDDHQAHKFPVAIGLTSRTLAEVTSGIAAGDRVIVHGQEGLPEGAAIAVDAP